MQPSPLRHVVEVIGVSACVLVLIFSGNSAWGQSATQTFLDSTQDLVSPPTTVQTASLETGAGTGGCPAGQEPIPTADRLYATDAGIPTSSQCWSPTDPNIGLQVGEAKADLISRYNPGSCSSIGFTNPKVQGIQGLDPTFAVNLDTMLKAMPGNMGLISAKRNTPCPNDSGVAAQDSNHLYGCAVDLASSAKVCDSTCKWIQQNGAQYNIQLRLPYSPEFNHIEPSNIPACRAHSGGQVASIVPPKPGANIAAAVQGAAQAVLQSAGISGDLGGEPTPTNTTGINGIPAAGSVLASNYYCVTSVNPVIVVPLSAGSIFPSGCYNGSTALAATNSGQCSLGLVNLGGTCVPMSMMQSMLSPQTAAPIPPPPAAAAAPAATTQPVSTVTQQAPATAQAAVTNPSTIPSAVSSGSTSALALLQALANPQPTTATQQATATPVVLNTNTQTTVTQLTPTAAPASQSSASLGQITTEQPSAPTTQEAPPSTFTSGELNGSQAGGYVPQQSTFSPALAILQNLQGELINALQYLKPFQGNVPIVS